MAYYKNVKNSQLLAMFAENKFARLPMTKKLLALFFALFLTATTLLPLSANAGFGTFSASFGYGSSRFWFGSSYGSRYSLFGYGPGGIFGRSLYRRVRYPSVSYSRYFNLQKKTEAMVLAKKEIYFAENIPAKDAVRLQDQGVFPALVPTPVPDPKIDVDPSIHNDDPEKQPIETIKSLDGLVVVNYY